MTVDDRQRATLERATAHALAYLGTLDDAPVNATTSLAELRRRFVRPLPDAGVDPTVVVDELARDVAGGLLGSAGGRFYGWVIGAGLPSALAADWLTATWDQNAGLYACGPAAAVVEEACGRWLKDLLGLPASASYALVTGCQMAHVTCLAAARHALLARAGWDVHRDGLAGGPSLRVLTSGEVHGTTTRAVRLLGLGTANIMLLPSDDASRLTPEVLREALAREPERPTIVVLQAGDVNCGAFDPFPELIAIAHAAGAWVHVDGAMGLWANAAPALRHLLAGVERADSWATDGHKWLNVPYDCGYAFVAHPEHHRAAMAHRASYLSHADDVRDQLDWTPDHSRRARGFATFAALRELGRAGVADLVTRCCTHARAIVTRIGALPGAETLAVPIINQGLVRFPDPRPDATAADHDARTDAVVAAINATGEAFFTGTTWRGMRAMRVSVSSWRTTTSDVDRAVAAAARVLHEIPGSRSTQAAGDARDASHATSPPSSGVPAMLETPHVTQTTPQPVAIIHLQIPRDAMQREMGPGIGELMSTVAAQGLTPTGPWFNHHLTMAPDRWDFEIGVPVSAPVTASGRVRPSERPAMTVARTTYTGPYEGLGAAWGEFMAWIAREGHTPADDLYEAYVAGPESVANPAEYRTTFERPLRGA